jgi:hypothetical protein
MTSTDLERGFAAGLTVEQLAVLTRGRKLWRAENEGQLASETPMIATLTAQLPPGWWIDDELVAACRLPAAKQWDAVFVQALRRRFS